MLSSFSRKAVKAAEGRSISCYGCVISRGDPQVVPSSIILRLLFITRCTLSLNWFSSLIIIFCLIIYSFVQIWLLIGLEWGWRRRCWFAFSHPAVRESSPTKRFGISHRRCFFSRDTYRQLSYKRCWGACG